MTILSRYGMIGKLVPFPSGLQPEINTEGVCEF